MTTPERSRAAALLGAASAGKPRRLTPEEREKRRARMIAWNKRSRTKGSMTLKYAGGREVTLANEDAVIALIIADYPDYVAAENWEPQAEGRERLLIWANESAANNDDGARAVAEVVRKAGAQ
jgi:hypothetical protein